MITLQDTDEFANKSYDAYERAKAFLAALFEEDGGGGRCDQEGEGKSIDLASLALEFRERMTVGQTVGQCNPFREKF